MDLSYDGVHLSSEKRVPGDLSRGFVPYDHFKIQISDNDHTSRVVVGHINLRLGNTPHVEWVAGHIGYHVLPEFRGRRIAYRACLALAPLVREHYATAILTVDPDNQPSIRVIELLGAEMLGEVDVPESDPAYRTGARRKRRYAWSP